MPKATIISETGFGEYVIQLEYDLVRALERKDTVIFQISEVEKVIVTLQAIVNTKEAERDAAATEDDNPSVERSAKAHAALKQLCLPMTERCITVVPPRWETVRLPALSE